MNNKNSNHVNLIIGGTIKAATSSIFTYLSAHPEVCGSSVKETFFFSHRYTGSTDHDLENYMSFFSPEPATKVVAEASPNYLAYKENVAPRIKQLLPDAKLLFILRNPIDRLYSYYNFAVGKLEISKNLPFDEYVDLCLDYSSSMFIPSQKKIAEKHLRALEVGKYSKYLQNYFDLFSTEQVKVVFYDDLKKDPIQFLADICHYINVDPGFYVNYTLNKVNVTFSARMKLFHKAAMLLNRALESVLRQRPDLKMRLVGMYKKLNQDREGYVAMPDSTRARLMEIYAPYNKELEALLSGVRLPEWAKAECVEQLPSVIKSG